MVDFGESDREIKISGKVDKSSTYNGFISNISFFIHGKKILQIKHFKSFSEVLP